MGVAVVLSLTATAVVAAISRPTAAVLAICLLITGVVAPWLAGNAAAGAVNYCSATSFRTRYVGYDCAQTCTGTSRRRCTANCHRRITTPAIVWCAVLDATTRPVTVAATIPTAAIGGSVLGAVIAGIAIALTVAQPHWTSLYCCRCKHLKR